MMFSVNKQWERCVVPLPELSISLPAPVYGKREFFLSLSGELETFHFEIVPHVLPDWTITVSGTYASPSHFRSESPERKPVPSRRRVAGPNFYTGHCRLRL